VGVATVRALLSAAVAMGVPRERLAFDPSLARGADYYTGPVFEIAGDEPGVGSLGGGGRYDGLVERLSGRDLPAVGVSLGLERLLVIMEGRGMLPEPRPAADVLVTVFDDASAAGAAAVAHAMREGGARAELFVGDGRAKAQFKYAGRRGFRWVAIVGPDEIAAGTVTLKGGPDGGTHVLPVAEAVRRVAGVDPAPGAR
jgi:histidyl-tRNA synthetase